MEDGYTTEAGHTHNPERRLHITAGDLGIKIVNYSTGGIRPAPHSGNFERSMGRAHEPMPWQVRRLEAEGVNPLPDGDEPPMP